MPAVKFATGWRTPDRRATSQTVPPRRPAASHAVTAKLYLVTSTESGDTMREVVSAQHRRPRRSLRRLLTVDSCSRRATGLAMGSPCECDLRRRACRVNKSRSRSTRPIGLRSQCLAEEGIRVLVELRFQAGPTTRTGSISPAPTVLRSHPISVLLTSSLSSPSA